LTIYSRILNAFVIKKGWEIEDIYVFGNWEGIIETSYKYEEVEEIGTKKVLKSYRAFDVDGSVIEDDLFDQVTELKVYPKERGENDPPFLKIRYVPMPYLVDRGMVDEVIKVVLVPKEKADKNDPGYTQYKYFVVSEKFKTEKWIEYNWIERDMNFQRLGIKGYVLYESPWNDLGNTDLARALRSYNPHYSIKELEKKSNERPKEDYKLKIRPKNPTDISAWLKALKQKS